MNKLLIVVVFAIASFSIGTYAQKTKSKAESNISVLNKRIDQKVDSAFTALNKRIEAELAQIEVLKTYNKELKDWICNKNMHG